MTNLQFIQTNIFPYYQIRQDVLQTRFGCVVRGSYLLPTYRIIGKFCVQLIFARDAVLYIELEYLRTIPPALFQQITSSFDNSSRAPFLVPFWSSGIAIFLFLLAQHLCCQQSTLTWNVPTIFYPIISIQHFMTLDVGGGSFSSDSDAITVDVVFIPQCLVGRFYV